MSSENENNSVSYNKTPKSAKCYFTHLCQCMSLKDGVIYSRDHIFENHHLLTLTPRDICNYFNLKAFGTENPNEEATSKHGRSSSLMFYKKSISYFMPNKLIGWNVGTNVGNPTKSVEVNNLIKKVQKMEVRKQGKASQATRPLTIAEMKFVFDILRKSSTLSKKLAVPALCTFQFHLIGRIDDTCRFDINELYVHGSFDFALRGRMCWSKNVMEEREAPPQIILGANDPGNFFISFFYNSFFCFN